jgi:predicted RNA-binding protein
MMAAIDLAVQIVDMAVEAAAVEVEEDIAMAEGTVRVIGEDTVAVAVEEGEARMDQVIGQKQHTVRGQVLDLGLQAHRREVLSIARRLGRSRF